MKCPHCLSENTHFVSKTESTGPSFFKGCCGIVLFGPLGILCSLCGVSSETEEYWMCYSCGKRFDAGEYETELQIKRDRVNRLKKDISSLEAELRDRPKNLLELIDEAEAEYNDAKKICDGYNEEFINAYSVVKTINCIGNIITIIAFIIFGGGIIAGIMSLEDGGITTILVSVVVSFLMIVIIANIEKTVKKKADPERAECLQQLEKERDFKQKIYKELQEMQRKTDSHQQKLKDLSQAEKDLKNYSRK